MLKPRQAVPSLDVQLTNNKMWKLSEQTPENFIMLAFYRGLHCPICKRYLSDLNRKLADFESRGISVLALSSDSKERALLTEKDWGLSNLTLGYGVTIEKAREWGLYISTSRGKTSLGIMEPDVFSEPGLFLIRPDLTLYSSIVQTMPFARPYFSEVLSSVDFIIENDYPARGQA